MPSTNSPSAVDVSASSYDDSQKQNSIKRFLHSFRHVRAAKLASDLHRSLNRPLDVLDIGCATGKTFGFVDASCPVSFVGMDIRPQFIDAALARYATYSNARFIVADATSPEAFSHLKADVVLALETFEHIDEGAVVRIVENVCHILRPALFIVSVPVEVGPAIWIKNVGSALMGHSRHEYSVEDTFWAGLYNLNRVPVHASGHRGFNWVWLEQTIRWNSHLKESCALPFSWIPKALAPTVMFISDAREASSGRHEFRSAPGLCALDLL